MRQAVPRLFVVLFLAGAPLSGCGQDGVAPELEEGPVVSTSQGLVIPERALAVTEKVILEGFPLERVMKHIIGSSGVPGVSPVGLFQQWWDTQNMAPGMLGSGPHCDDEIVPPGVPGINGFPWECPRAEGYQAGIDPFVGPVDQHLYMPVGLFNRFDLMPANGAHCGEYRIAYAMRPNHPDAAGNGRNFLIFEAVLPNPDPGSGAMGCYEVAKFWYQLSFENDAGTRRKLLEEFYFKGLPGYAPVVDAEHYGTHLGGDGYGCSTGQIRTNQFIQDDWNLREFRLVKDCRCNKCVLAIVPTTVKNNPWGPLFNPLSGHPEKPLLQSEVVGSVWSLGQGGVNELGWAVTDKVNSGESIAVFHGPYDYLDLFQAGTPSDPTFHDDIDAQINIHYPGVYKPEHIILRAQTQSCAGCHHTTNGAHITPPQNGAPAVEWPHSIKFVHVEEFSTGPAFDLSHAMQTEFLPHRAKLLEDFVLSGGSQVPANGDCKLPMPKELDLDCKVDSGTLKTRTFPVRGIEALKRELPPSIGGSLTH